MFKRFFLILCSILIINCIGCKNADVLLEVNGYEVSKEHYTYYTNLCLDMSQESKKYFEIPPVDNLELQKILDWEDKWREDYTKLSENERIESYAKDLVIEQYIEEKIEEGKVDSNWEQVDNEIEVLLQFDEDNQSFSQYEEDIVRLAEFLKKMAEKEGIEYEEYINTIYKELLMHNAQKYRLLKYYIYNEYSEDIPDIANYSTDEYLNWFDEVMQGYNMFIDGLVEKADIKIY